MQIGLLGYGTVGKAFHALSKEQPALTVKTLLTRRPRGTGCRETDSFADIVNDPNIDLVVELIGGIHPAYEYISAALRAKKHVVTANKAVICAYYPELVQLAQENGVCLRCTAAAGGGIPWLSSLSRVARMDRITAVEGILNGTTNYILSEMTARNAAYGELLAEAQKLGYAEADPTDDVEGYDARRKLVLSANLAFSALLREQDIPCIGISPTCWRTVWRSLTVPGPSIATGPQRPCPSTITGRSRPGCSAATADMPCVRRLPPMPSRPMPPYPRSTPGRCWRTCPGACCKRLCPCVLEKEERV